MKDKEQLEKSYDLDCQRLLPQTCKVDHKVSFIFAPPVKSADE